jgi:general stress protein 26
MVHPGRIVPSHRQEHAMNSINENQPEQNRRDLVGQDAIKELKDIVKSAETCFFVTTTYSGASSGARPMSVREVDDQGSLWFLMASDSHTVAEIAIDPAVTLFVQGSAHSEFLHLRGHATVSKDKARIHELWNPVYKTWFTEGEDDLRITVVKVVLADAYYWDNKHGDAVAGIKMMIGAAIGKTLDDSIEGKLSI